MTRRRRALLLLGLALVLGALAATNVSRREAALRAQLGPLTQVVVARHPVAAGHLLTLADLGVRLMPSRYAPAGSTVYAAGLAGRRLAVPVAEGGAVTEALLVRHPGAPALRPGQRAVDVVAAGSPQGIVAGARVDVLVTREGAGDDAGSTTLALEDVEVLAAGRAPDAGGSGPDAGLPRVALDLRVSVRQAVYLAAAQSFARELRVLPRAPGDRRRGAQGLRVGGAL
jgi:pilus assembly protein CpaB